MLHSAYSLNRDRKESPVDYLAMFKEAADTVKHVTPFIALGALGGSGITWWLQRRGLKTQTQRRRVTFQLVSLRGDVVDFRVMGDSYTLAEVIGHKGLEDRIAAATKRTKTGILRVKDGISHATMMGILEDHIGGNDPPASMALVKGRFNEVNEDRVSFCPTFFRDEEDGAEIRVFIVDDALLPKMRDPKFFGRLSTKKPRHKTWLDVLKQMAEEEVAPTQAHGTTAAVWHTTVDTAKRAAAVERSRNVA